MNNDLLDALRYKSEGTDLDFKSAQYRFVGGNETDKSEMLKDILAMANSWRDGTGYILLGFKDARPRLAEVAGIAEHLDDAAVQQFVHGKVKPKLTFKYEEHLYEGKTIGVISIPKQRRPFFLANPYGKLKSNVVYVRRGSSTDEAEPTEAAAMVSADAGRGEVRIDLSVLTPDNGQLPDTVELRYIKFSSRLPDYEKKRQTIGPLGIEVPSIWHANRDFWREVGEYARVRSALIELQFVLANRSDMALSSAKLEVTVEPLDGQELQMWAGTDLPEQPETEWSPIHGSRSLVDVMARRDAKLVVDAGGLAPVCHIRFGTLLPGESARASDALALIPLGPGKMRIRLRVLAGELATPIQSERLLVATGPAEVLGLEGLKKLLAGTTTRTS